MASQLEILLIARDQFSAPMQKYGAALGMISKQADEAASKVEQAGQKASKFGDAASKIDAAGRNARSGLSAMSQAAQLVGVDISGITNVAAGASDAIGDMAGALESFGTAAIGIGVAVAAVALIVKKLQEQHDATTKTIAATDHYLDSMAALTQGNAEAAASIQQIASSMATLQGMGSRNPLTQMFESFGAAKIQLEDFFNSLEHGIVRFRSLGEVIEAQKGALNDLTFGARSGYDALERLRASSTSATSAAYAHSIALQAEAEALDYVAAAARRAADAMGDTRAEGIEGRREDMRGLAEFNTEQQKEFDLYVKNNHAMDVTTNKAAAINDYYGKRFPVSMAAAKDANEAWLKSLSDTSAYDKAKAAIQAINAKLRGLVESALNPTTVEQRLGMAGDAWDEFRLRLEAVATGTDPSQYGEEFVKQMNALGMSAEQAAQAFKDFSLFSDPANLKLVNFAPIVADVQHQLDAMIGKANLTSAAMKEVWKNLSPQQKAALGAQGIDSATDAVTALIDPAGQAKVQAQGLQEALNNIPKTVTTTFNVMYAAAEAAITAFREVLDKFIADYGSVTISINAETSATPPPPGGSGGPPPSTPPPPGGEPFATGGMVIPKGFNRDTYPVRVNLSSDEILHVFNPRRPSDGGGKGGQPIYISIDGSPFRRISDRRISGYASLGATN